MKELVFPHMYRPAMEQYRASEGLVDGDYRSTWSQRSFREGRAVTVSAAC